MKSNRSVVVLAVGVFLLTVVLVLVVLRGGILFAPEQATRLALADCDLQQGPCSVKLPGGGSVTLVFSPLPVRPMQDFSFRLDADGVEIKKAALSFSGVSMNMGLNRFELQRDNGAFTGEGILPVCIRSRMEWEAQARISTAEGVFDAPFRFTTYKH
ncbi:MAG: hypothetical protein DSZ32_03820 [Gammaproteobacteria bacterium]|nr:MAG: hypothetical protein DSZ32_03820 [Gammaproteobacteria bacterium]